jgi:hypothetical protein
MFAIYSIDECDIDVSRDRFAIHTFLSLYILWWTTVLFGFYLPIQRVTQFSFLVSSHPTQATAQIAYINHFLIAGNTFGEAEELFRNFLRQSPSVDLYRFYLTYVRRVNTSPTTRDQVRQSYEFALNHIGHDKDSGEIWWDYVQFLNEAQVRTY